MRAQSDTKTQRQARRKLRLAEKGHRRDDLLPCPSCGIEHPPVAPCVCKWCGAIGARGVCPRSIACPDCNQGQGAPCLRPSGHQAPQLHAARIAAAEGMDATAGETDIDRDIQGDGDQGDGDQLSLLEHATPRAA